MATARIDVIITAKDKASAVMKKFSRSLESAQKSSRAVATGLLAVAAAATAVIAKSTLTAARTETLGVAMNAVAKATGTSIKELQRQEKTLKEQGITTQAARTILTQFMQANLDVADASNIARVAQDLAVIAGENSSETARKLTQAIASQEPMLLRNVGIVTTLPNIYNEYAKTVGKAAKDLTDLEKRQAFVNKILKEGEKVAGAYEEAMGTAGKKLSSLPRLFEEASNSIGSFFLPAFGEVIDKLSEFLKLITPENIEKWINKLKEMPETIGIIVGALIGALLPAFIGLAASIVIATLPLLPWIAAGAALGLIAAKLIKHFGGMDEILNKLKPTFKIMGEIWEAVILPVLQDLWKTITENLVPALKEFWKIAGPILTPVLKFLGGAVLLALIGAIMLAIKGFTLMIKVSSAVVRGITGIIKWIKNLINWFSELVKGIKSSFSGLSGAIIAPFKKAFDWINKKSEGVKNALNKLNPWAKSSPSLIENIRSGTKVIRDEFQGLFNDLQLSAPGLIGAGNTTNQTQNLSINITGGINNTGGLSPDEIVQQIARQLELSRQGGF